MMQREAPTAPSSRRNGGAVVRRAEQPPAIFAAWLGFVVMVFGVWIVMEKELSLLPLFFIMGYGALLGMVISTTRYWKDLINPLALLLLVQVVRFSVPAAILLYRDPSSVRRFAVMGLTPTDFSLGHVMAVTGFVALAVGWTLYPGRRDSSSGIRVALLPGTQHIAIAGMVMGFLFLVLFVSGNVESIGSTVLGGTFRGEEIQEGTGFLRHLGLLFPTSAIIYSAYLMGRKDRPNWRALLPALFATLVLLVLGGRGRASTAFVAALLLLGYMRLRPVPWRLSFAKLILGVVVVVPALIGFAYLGVVYRGEGIQGVRESFHVERVGTYLEESFLLDIGSLHGLAAASRQDPGVLGPGSLLHHLLWPASEALGIKGRSSGIYLVEVTVRPGPDRHGGIHPSLMGDTYLQIGSFAIVLAPFVLGLLLKAAYVRFRSRRMHAVYYTLIAVFGVKILTGSAGAWIDFLILSICTFVLFRASWLISPEDTAHRRRVPAASQAKPTRREIDP